MRLAKTVLITGVAGFLGRYVARHFAAEGWRVVGIDDVPPARAPQGAGITFHRLALPHPALPEILRAESPQACVHCAGRASVPLSMTEPAADFHANTVLTFEILDALRRHAPGCRFLLLSSAAVYGNPAILPVLESHPVAPLSPYGFHKRQCELLGEEFARVYGVPATSVRIFSAYGEGLRRQVIWDICERVLTTGKLALGGTGGESRDFIHAADVARALVLLADRAPGEGEIFNVATGREITVAALAAMIIQALGSDVMPAFDGVVRAGDPRNWRADISRLAALGFAPSISLEDGTRGVADWAAKELTAAT